MTELSKKSYWNKFSRQFFKITLIFLSLIILMGLSVVGVFSYISFDLPDVRTLANYGPPLPSQILSEDGEVLLSMGRENREMVEISDIPKLVIDAFLSAEDANFFEHKGVDYLGMLRALLVDIKAGKIVQGGSTITQQVAKSLLLSREKSLIRKIKDILLAQKIEEVFTKEEILYLYLNHVYLGGGYYGVKAALKGYFDKDLIDATVSECALIAGLLVAPGRYSPYVNPQFAKMRQRYVLKRMYETKKITEIQYEKALKDPLRIRNPQIVKPIAGYFTDWIKQRVINVVGQEKFLTGGLKIVTTIDSELQKTAEKMVLAGVKAIDKRQGFKGPIKELKSEDEIKIFIINFRKKFLIENSHYFFLNENGSINYESEFMQSEYNANIQEEERIKIEEGLDDFEVSILPDKLANYIKEKETYEAVVLKVSDAQKMIYISLGGVKGVIPLEHFKWAHERKIHENLSINTEINKPSKILKRGDIIHVTYLEGPVSLWDYISSEFKKEQKNRNLIASLKKQKFYIFKLDQDPEVQGALVAIQPDSGKIISMVGGSDFIRSQFNRAIQAKRQPGSSFKPILFAAGLEEGFTPSDIIIDSPEALVGVEDNLTWKPKNYDGEFLGPMTFRRSLEQSRNVPTIKLAGDIGVKKIISFANRIGLKAKLEPDLSMALGSFGVSLMEMVFAYSIFPSGGKIFIPKSITSITDRFGKSYPIQEFEPEREDFQKNSLKHSVESEIFAAEDKENKGNQKNNPYLASLGGERVYDSRLAYIMSNLLRGVVQNGTGKGAKDLSYFIGGKTGTTNDYVDAWFIGFSSNLVAGVWTGFDDNKTLGHGETGSKAALPIWKGFMKSGLKKFGDHDFSVPPGIINVLIDRNTGKLTSGENPDAFMEAFVEGTEPGKTSIQDTSSEPEFNGLLEENDYFLNQ